MSRPENLTTDEAEIWQRMEQHGEELVRDMVREEWADPLKRLQEKRASAKHRAGKQEGSAV